MVSKQQLNSPVELCNVDRLGNLYLSDEKGNLLKIDQAGQHLAQFASLKYGKISMLESWTSLRIFLFYEDIQQYLFLDRFLNQSEFMHFPPGLFGLIALASPSSDNQLWLYDSAPFNLIKFDINFGSITLTQSLNQIVDTSNLNPYMLLEYQNRVYLGDSDLGILVFDNLGNYIHTLSKTGSERCFPYREELYFLRNNQLNFISIYDQDRRVMDLPDTQSQYLHAQLTENSLVVITAEHLFIYRYTPR